MSERWAIQSPAGPAEPIDNSVPKEGTAALPVGEELGRVLGPLLELSFVLTDRDGIVTRWTQRAESLFGWESSTAVGRALLDTLIAADSSAPPVGRLETSVRHRDGTEFPVEFTFIPVPMSHSLEFNGFLESLESKRPREAVLRRVQSQYSDVLDWVGSIVEDGGVPLHSDEMTAGTIVTFLPLVEAPWSEPDAETASDANGAAPPAASSAAFAKVVDRATEALSRSEAIERSLGEATASVEEARARAEAAHEQAAAAASRVAELGDENATLRAELDRARAELGELRRDLEAEERAPATDPAELELLKQETDRLRGEITALRETPPATPGEVERLHELAESLKAQVEEVRAGAERAVESLLDGAREAAEAAAVEAKVARVQAEAARVHADESGTHAQTAKDVAEAWAGAVEEPQRSAEEAPTPGRAADRRLEKQPEPAREPRPGFDDEPQAMAVIALDGHFRELNPAFSELVGYSEHDFRVASWPPVADRRQLEHHREQMEALLAGEEKSVEVNTGYVHAQGLLVPIAGKLSLVRDDSGEPDHYLLQVAPPASRSA
jgi:PAS domain S-box-containing protein